MGVRVYFTDPLLDIEADHRAVRPGGGRGSGIYPRAPVQRLQHLWKGQFQRSDAARDFAGGHFVQAESLQQHGIVLLEPRRLRFERDHLRAQLVEVRAIQP